MKRIFHEKRHNAVVHLLDGEELSSEVTKSATGREILDKVCQHVGLDEVDFFGLKFVCPKDKQLNWIDNIKTIGKQMGNGPYHLIFQVKFYPPNPAAVREDITRYQIVLQLRDDLLKERLVCSVPIHALLASYLIQAENGDYDPNEHSKDYIDGLQFMPNQTDDFLPKVHDFHKKHKGLAPSDAEYHYLDNARKIPLYGMDLHDALDGDNTSVVLGVSETGIHVILKGREISKFSWSNIHKVYFKSKRFYLDIRVVTEVEYEDLTVGFKSRSRTELKRLYRSAIDHHTFFRRDASVLGSQKVSFFKLGSRFRYSGRKTFQQLKKTKDSRAPPSFERVSSQRLTKTSAGKKSERKEAEVDAEKITKEEKSTPAVDDGGVVQAEGSPTISKNVVIAPSEETDPVNHKPETNGVAKANNDLGVTITISPPTPVPGNRRTIDLDGDAEVDPRDDSPESYDVIELYEGDGEAADSPQPTATGEAGSANEEKGQCENESVTNVNQSQSVTSFTEIEHVSSETSQETTTSTTVVESKTITSKIVTQTEIITVNELDEEIVLVEEEHITEAGTGE